MWKKFNDRQIHTLIAALRHWEAHMDSASDEIRNIASNDQMVDPLTADEVDELCMDLNCSNDIARVVVDMSCGGIHGATSDTDNVEVVVFDSDTEGCDEDRIHEVGGRDVFLAHQTPAVDGAFVEMIFKHFRDR